MARAERPRAAWRPKPWEGPAAMGGGSRAVGGDGQKAGTRGRDAPPRGRAALATLSGGRAPTSGSHVSEDAEMLFFFFSILKYTNLFTWSHPFIERRRMCTHTLF